MNTDYHHIAQELLIDPEARRELACCTDLDEVLAVAARLTKQRGHDVTPEQLRQALTLPHGELSDTELETVVGGKGDNGEGKYIVGHGTIS